MQLRIQALHVGTITNVSRARMTYDRGYADTATAELLMFVIVGGEHPVVVDTGSASPENVRDRHGLVITREPGQEPLAALQAAGIDPAEVRTVINTHLHWDHCSNNDLFPNARVLVQQSELRYAIDPMEPNLASYERRPGMQPPWIGSLGRMQSVAGDQDVMDGIRLVHLPGHTPGSQGVLVGAGSTRYLIAGDCISWYANWHGDERLGHIPVGSFTSLRHYMRSFAKIEQLGCEVIPSHDPEVVARGSFG